MDALTRCLAGLLLAAGCTFQFFESAPFDEEYPVGEHDRLALDGVAGDLELRGLGETSAVLRGTRHALGRTRDEAMANLRHADLEAREDGATLRLVFDPPLELVGAVDVELDRVGDVPAHLGVSADLGDGDIAVDGIRGPLDLGTRDGDVRVVAGGEATVTVRARGGRAEIEARGGIDAEADRDLELVARGRGGQPVAARADGGDVLLDVEPQALRIRCHPGGGQVVVDEALGAEVDASGEDLVLVSRGDAAGAREVEIWSNGGRIEIRAILFEPAAAAR